jgi:hypothetical protein
LDALQAIDLRPHLERLGRPWSSVIGSVLPSGSYGEWAEEVPPIQESSLPRRLLDAFTLLLESIAREYPTVFLLDDLQWADATTVAVLQFSQRRWTNGSFGIIASLRPELTTEDHPAGKYVLEGDELDTCRIHLGDLSDREAEELVGGIALGVAATPVKQLCALAGPHPLYLTELTRDYLSGRFRLPDLPAHDVTIPISLQQVLRSKISGISPRALRVAGLLAVGARAIRLSDLPTLAGLTFHECIESVEELERGRLVEVRRDRVRISHDLFRSALYNHMSEARRAMLHKAIADHLIEKAQEEACGGLAIHLARAGESDAAAQYAWQAAMRAWDSGAMAEAAYFYELVTDNEREPERRAEATAGLAQALHLTRDLRRANPALELAASRLRERGRLDRARRLEVHRVEGLAAVDAAPVTDLIGRLEAIKAEARDHNDWEAVALALNSALRLRNRTGDLRGINDVFDEMREAADQRSPAAALVCHAGLAMQAMFGDPTAGLSSARHAVSLEAPSTDYRLTALIRLLVVLQYQGRIFLPEASIVLDEARLLAERSGDRWARFGIENNYALAVLDAGDADAARELMAEAGAILGSADLDIPRFNLANNQAEVELASEDYDAAFAWYVKAGQYVGPNSPAYAQDLVNAGLGLCALQTGNLSEARRRELVLGPPPVPWFYDPTTILTFRAKLLERRGERLAALALLSEHVESLRERLVFAWMKLSALLVRMEIRECCWDSAQKHASECLDRAITLRLPRRAAEFSHLMKETVPRVVEGP